MFRTLKKKTIMVKNIDVRIKYAAGYDDYEIAESCGMDLNTFREKWREVLDRENYLYKQGFDTDAKDFIRDGIFCIKGMNQS